eukprot:EG_transcript_7789
MKATVGPSAPAHRQSSVIPLAAALPDTQSKIAAEAPSSSSWAALPILLGATFVAAGLKLLSTARQSRPATLPLLPHRHMLTVAGEKSVDAPAKLQVPVIDLSRPEDEVIAAIKDAAVNWTSFAIVNHGVPKAEYTAAYASARHFFALPEEVKRQVKRTEENSRGWFDDELTKQQLDWKQGFDFGHKPAPDLPDDHPANRSNDGYNQWPKSVPEFKEQMERYYQLMEDLARRLTYLFARALDLPGDYFDPYFKRHTSFLRLNYYPISPDPTKLGVGPHKDAGFLTILLVDEVPSLQVFKDGQWVTVPYIPDAYVINVGDLFQVWSNDSFPASLHRVLSNTTADRISLPFFYNPEYSTDVTPITNGGPPKFRPLNWGEYRRRRYEGDYADRGVEIQIDNYRL